MPRPIILRNDLVRIRPGGKVYRVYVTDGVVARIMQPIKLGRNHPDAAKRSPDALHNYPVARLIRVGNDETGFDLDAE